MFANKGTGFVIIRDDLSTVRAELSQNLWSIQKGTKFRDEVYGCFEVKEIYSNGEFTTTPITYEKLNEEFLKSK